MAEPLEKAWETMAQKLCQPCEAKGPFGGYSFTSKDFTDSSGRVSCEITVTLAGSTVFCMDPAYPNCCPNNPKGGGNS